MRGEASARREGSNKNLPCMGDEERGYGHCNANYRPILAQIKIAYDREEVQWAWLFVVFL